MKQLYRLTGNSLCRYCTSLPFTLSLLFFLLFTFTSQAQVTVNAYAKVTGITTVSSKSQLAIVNSNTTGHGWVVGEEVIVIQMQDNVISGTGNTAGFGMLSGISNAGAYELATITATTGTSITLNKLLTKPFHFGSNSKVQVVSFTALSTGNFTTSANITALPWNGSLGRGGVVAISVPGILTLKHSIIVDGQGFSGGAASNDASPGCGATNYTSTSTSYGAKGEGIYLVDTPTNSSFFRGRARLVSGGGGGNSGGSGGGGGSNFSAGGDGSSYWLCGDGGGLGGVALNGSMLTGDRVFLGGGGGGAQGDGSQTNGGNGGGIILIRAGAINTSCSSGPLVISANGVKPGTSGSDGAGGGGAAGTILLQIGSYTVPAACKLTVQANGGNGGDANSFFPYGAGGGGGQGAVLITGNPTMSNITTQTKPGAGGSESIFGGNAASAAGTNTSGIIGGIGVVLPVHLLFFSADNKNGKAVLTWTSADEADVTYTIERSTDGSNFTAIGTVTGNGQTNYSFTDPEPLSGRVYYRLVMTGDLTSKTTYSSIVNVSMSNASQVAVAYPNPAHDHFYIRISGDNNKLYKVAVTDLAGQIVYTTTGIPANNIIKVTPGRALKPGLYMFKVTSGGFEQAGKVMVR